MLTKRFLKLQMILMEEWMMMQCSRWILTLPRSLKSERIRLGVKLPSISLCYSNLMYFHNWKYTCMKIQVSHRFSCCIQTWRENLLTRALQKVANSLGGEYGEFSKRRYSKQRTILRVKTCDFPLLNLYCIRI